MPNVPLSLSDPTPTLNLLGDHPPSPSGMHQCWRFPPCGLSRIDFVMVYPFARHADGTNRKWVAGTEGVQSQSCSGSTESEGSCDHCQQVASDKELWWVMQVALGELKKSNLITVKVRQIRNQTAYLYICQLVSQLAENLFSVTHTLKNSPQTSCTKKMQFTAMEWLHDLCALARPAALGCKSSCNIRKLAVKGAR